MLIAVIGASNVLWLDAATFAISAVVIGALVPDLTIAVQPGQPRRYFADLAEGLRFIWNDRLMRAMSSIFALGNFLDAPISLLFALYAIRHYDSAVPVGLMFAALGAGAVVSSLWYGAVGLRLPRRAIFAAYCIPVAVMYLTFAFTPPLPLLLAVVFMDGLAVGPINPLSATVTQERVPVFLRGRVTGMRTAISFMTIPLGRGLAGLLVDPLGLRTIFIAIACTFALMGVVIALAPAFRTMHAPTTAQPVAIQTHVSRRAA
jgi:MFS family permease